MARKQVRGFAWFIFPNPRDPEDLTEPGRPFEGVAKGGDLPPGVVDFWPLDPQMGLENERTGIELLVVTESPSPPPLHSSYSTAPAELPDGFQAGGGLVRLARVLGRRPTDRGEVAECEFAVDQELPIETTGATPQHLVGPRQAGAASVEAGVNTTGTGTGTDARPGGRRSAATATGESIGMGAGAAGHAGTPLGARPGDTEGASAGQSVGNVAGAPLGGARADPARADDPSRSVASPDEIAAGAGESGNAGAGA